MSTEFNDQLVRFASECDQRADRFESLAQQAALKADAAEEQATKLGLSGDMPQADAEIERLLNLAYLNGRRRDAALSGKVLVSDYDDNDKNQTLRKLVKLAGADRWEIDRPPPEVTKGLRRGSAFRIA